MKRFFDNISSQHLARAIAILLIVANHAFHQHLSIDISGGMLFLLFVSGYYLAQFSVGKNEVQLRAYLIKFTKKLVVPCFLISCFYFIWFQNLNFTELFFVHNWVSRQSIPWLPTWYPQMLLQLMVMLIALFYLIKPTRYINRTPINFAVSALLLSCVLFLLSDYIRSLGWASSDSRLPFSYLWCLFFGWLVYSLGQMKKHYLLIFVASLAFILGGVLVYPDSQKISSTLIFTVLTLLFVSNISIKMPSFLVVKLNLIANATFYIFLWHMSCFYLYHVLTGWQYQNTAFDINMYVFAVSLPCILWLLVQTSRKAVVKTRTEISQFVS
ncbi:acyltransferase family protein [Catenovulum sp. SX2]|uniref:acyltransferase family protein n=1 Tax=Catenovulum sp. SX2 TaxID=3398614 RepID=UPI003F8620BB